MQGVEVVGASGVVDRIRSPHRGAVERGRAGPVVEPLRVRPHQDVRRPYHRVVRVSQRAHPPPHESGLRRAAAEECRADVEDERPIVGQPRTAAEGLTRERRPPIEPPVEALRAGHAHAVGGDAVEPRRFLPLDLVPHDHRIGHHPHERLAREVVPAPDAQGRPHAEPARGAHVIELRRAELDERGDEQHVRLVLADELVHAGLPRYRLLEPLEHARDEPPPRQPGEHQRERRRALVRALADLRHRRVSRVRVPQVVQREPQRTRYPAVPSPLVYGGHAARDVGARRYETVHERTAAERVVPVRRQVHPVPARRKCRDDGIEVPEVGEVAGDEEHLHGATLVSAADAATMSTEPSGSSEATPRNQRAKHRLRLAGWQHPLAPAPPPQRAQSARRGPRPRGRRHLEGPIEEIDSRVMVGLQDV